MQMDSKGAKDWKTLTEKNVGKPVAVTLDNRVYTAPNVVGAIQTVELRFPEISLRRKQKNWLMFLEQVNYLQVQK